MTDKLMTTVEEALRETGPALTKSLLEKVAGPVGEEKGRLLSQFIFGSITWSAAIGRPDGPTLASGFTITHECAFFEAVATADGINIRKGFAQVDDVSSWDAPAAGDTYQVAFLASWHEIAPNRFSVDLARMPWRDGDRRFGGVRSVRPRSALLAAPGHVQLLEFEVVQIPLLDIERAGVLTDG